MEIDWNLSLNFLAAILAIVNPIGLIPIWQELTADAIPKVRQQIALLATSVSVVILLVFLNAGTFLLNFAALSLVLSFSYKIEAKVNDLFFVAFTRIFGIMVAAIAIQFMVEGLGEIFPAWLQGPSPIKDNLEK